MQQRVFVHAVNPDNIQNAMRDAGGVAHECIPFGNLFVGYIDVPAHTVRQALRNDSRVSIIPNRHSQGNDISAHAKALGLQNAKTARDIFSAVFSATDMDVFDPDL